MTTQNSIIHLLVAKADANAGTTALDPSAGTYIADGQVRVTDIDGTVLTAGAVAGKAKIRIVQSQGALLPSIQSPEIELKAVKTYTGKLHTAATVQVDYIGFNAVTAVGDIDVINDNGYEVMIHNTNSAAWGSTGVSKFGFYVSDSTATKTEIVDAMTVSLFQNTTKLVSKVFKAERVSSNAGAVTGNALDTLVGALGSLTVTVTDIGGGTVIPIAAGDYIRVGVFLSSPVYKVVASTVGINGGVLTLDMPLQTAINLFGTSALFITAAQFVAGQVGIKLTGLDPVFVSPQSTEVYVNRWSTNLRNFGSTTATNAVVATEGVGSYPATACLEYFLVGNEGHISRNDTPYVNSRANVVDLAGYGFITLEWDSVKSGHIFNQQANSKQLLIAFAGGLGGGNRDQVTNGATTGVRDVLNAWLTASFTTLGAGDIA